MRVPGAKPSMFGRMKFTPFGLGRPSGSCTSALCVCGVYANFALSGSGNGGRSTGIRVSVMRVSGPSAVCSTTPGGTCTSSPGMRGVVATTSRVVGTGKRVAWALSTSGIQIVYGRTFVCPASMSTPTEKCAYVRPGRFAVAPSMSIAG